MRQQPFQLVRPQYGSKSKIPDDPIRDFVIFSDFIPLGSTVLTGKNPDLGIYPAGSGRSFLYKRPAQELRSEALLHKNHK
jgi:hypothetical protein